MVAGAVPGDRGRDVDAQLVFALAGPLAEWALSDPGGSRRYWLRVWGARGLLYAWDDRAANTVLAALSDEHWRVREMSAKVCGKHVVADAAPRLAGPADDDRDRVRQAARRALARIAAEG